jgi:hypothetical protein
MVVVGFWLEGYVGGFDPLVEPTISGQFLELVPVKSNPDKT